MLITRAPWSTAQRIAFASASTSISSGRPSTTFATSSCARAPCPAMPTALSDRGGDQPGDERAVALLVEVGRAADERLRPDDPAGKLGMARRRLPSRSRPPRRAAASGEVAQRRRHGSTAGATAAATAGRSGVKAGRRDAEPLDIGRARQIAQPGARARSTTSARKRRQALARPPPSARCSRGSVVDAEAAPTAKRAAVPAATAEQGRRRGRRGLRGASADPQHRRLTPAAKPAAGANPHAVGAGRERDARRKAPASSTSGPRRARVQRLARPAAGTSTARRHGRASQCRRAPPASRSTHARRDRHAAATGPRACPADEPEAGRPEELTVNVKAPPAGRASTCCQMPSTRCDSTTLRRPRAPPRHDDRAGRRRPA